MDFQLGRSLELKSGDFLAIMERRVVMRCQLVVPGWTHDRGVSCPQGYKDSI